MITATARGAHNRRVLLLGLSRENITRLLDGQALHISSDSHAGFPADVAIVMFFGETERVLIEQLAPFMDGETRVLAVPREKGSVS